MLASKAVGSYEMIIAARTLYGFSAGETLWRVRGFLCLSDWTFGVGRRSGTGHPSDVSDRDLTHKDKRGRLSERRHLLVSWQTVCSAYWTQVSGRGGSRAQRAYVNVYFSCYFQ